MSSASSPPVPAKPKPSTARLVQARVESGLTQEELARAAEVSLASIGKYERGTRSPKGARLRRIAEVTGKPVGWFFEETQAA